jgi:hypothetical protein
MTDGDRVAAQFTPGNAYSRMALGHNPQWNWWIPLAWQAAADPRGRHPVPPPPAEMGGDKGSADTLGPGGTVLAWWCRSCT